MKLRISEVLNITSLNAEFCGNESDLEQEINSISIDSRNVMAGDLFFAIRGDKFDGHQFVHDVLMKNAMAAVVAKTWHNGFKQNGNLIIVDDVLYALQEISRFYRLKFNIPIIAITGSNGKTTTKEMIFEILSRKYKVLKNKGNLNNHIGVPLTLFQLDHSYQAAVIEMGTNHFGEIKRLAEIACPGYGLITNIGPAHLEFFGSLEGVAKAKTELWDYLVEHNGTAFVNIDDHLIEQRKPENIKVITYGFEKEADVHGLYLGSDDDGCPKFRALKTDIALKTSGVHNIYNALASIAVAKEFNIEMSHIQHTLANFLPASKRMEIIRKNDITIINDSYNANLLSVQKALITLSQMKTTGRRIAVLADMLELGQFSETHHRQSGEFVVRLNIDYLFAYGPFSMNTVARAKEMGLQNANHYKDKQVLISDLKKMIRPHDILLIKGSRGMAMEEVTLAILNDQMIDKSEE